MTDAGVCSWTVGELLERLASDEPAPGGGAAAAITVAAAAGLVGMAARLSTRQLADAAQLASAADELRVRAARLADEDGAAYREVLAAYRAAHGDADAGGRVSAALAVASDVPLAVAEAAADIAELAHRLAAECNPSLRGDVLTAALLADAGARAATTLVELNTSAGHLDRIRADRANAASDRAAAAAAAVCQPGQ